MDTLLAFCRKTHTLKLMKMKIILKTIVLCLIVLGVQAQDVKFIPTAGINYSVISQDVDNYNISSRTGWHAGFEVKIGQKFYVSPGLYYVDSKSNIKGSDDIIIDPLDVRIKYKGLMIPVMFGGDLFASERLGLRAEVGPSLSIFLDESDEMRLNDILLEDTAWGVNVGFAADIGLLTVGIRQQFGLSPIFKWDLAGDAKLHLFQLHIGLRL